MDYCTKDDVKESLGTAETMLLADVEDSEISSIITETSGLIDDYISANVSLPFETTPQIIKTLCINISRYECYCRFATGDVPEPIQNEYNNTFKLLEKIRKKEIMIGTSSAEDDEETYYAVKDTYFTGQLQ